MDFEWNKFSNPDKFPNYQTEEMCLAAVKKDGRYLRYVSDQFKTNEVCKVAVEDHPFSILHVSDHTHDICLIAVRKNGLLLGFCKIQNEEICTEAVKQEPYALEIVNLQTPKICLTAIENCIQGSYSFTDILEMINIPIEGELQRVVNRYKLLGES